MRYGQIFIHHHICSCIHCCNLFHSHLHIGFLYICLEFSLVHLIHQTLVPIIPIVHFPNLQYMLHHICHQRSYTRIHLLFFCLLAVLVAVIIVSTPLPALVRIIFSNVLILHVAVANIFEPLGFFVVVICP